MHRFGWLPKRAGASPLGRAALRDLLAPRRGLVAQGELARVDALRAEGLCKALGGQQVVECVSLRVQRGEGVALLGPNGAGKTTLLLLFAGALSPDAGSVQVMGHAAAQRAARRALGFVPQDLCVYEELTGAENIALFGRLSGMRGRALAQGVRRALQAADLERVGDVRASAYSGGMCRRLSLACALVHGPSLLLLDEPFAGIDDASRAKLFALLAAEKQRGLALVLSTHRLDEVAVLCERLLELHAGRVVAERASPADPSWPRQEALGPYTPSAARTRGARR
jgi:ABC-2 type transport system ATP-binding protein